MSDTGTKRRKRPAGDAKSSNKAVRKYRSEARREPKVDPVAFWGDPASLPEPMRRIEPVDDVTALLSSLGRAPIRGRQTAAEHWFTLVYERAAMLAGALAAAGGLTGEPAANGSADDAAVDGVDA